MMMIMMIVNSNENNVDYVNVNVDNNKKQLSGVNSKHSSK